MGEHGGTAGGERLGRVFQEAKVRVAGCGRVVKGGEDGGGQVEVDGEVGEEEGGDGVEGEGVGFEEREVLGYWVWVWG